MLPSGNNATAPTVWRQFIQDDHSPIVRLHRLQSLLRTLGLALQTVHERDLQPVDVEHLGAIADMAFMESEEIGGELELWFTKSGLA